MKLTKETGDESTGAGGYSHGRNGGCGHVRGGQGGGQGNRHQKHECVYCQMNNYTTNGCRKRKRTERDTNTSRNDEWSCYYCGVPGHFKADCIHFKCAWDQCNEVIKRTASALLTTAGDRDLI